MIKEVFPPEEVGKAFGMFGPIMGLSAVGGPILDLVPHVASVVNKIAGVPESAVAVTVRQGAWEIESTSPDGSLPADTCMAVVRYPNDVLAQIHVGWATPFARNGLEINGSTGSLIAERVLWADPGGSVTLVTADGRHELAFARHDDAYQANPDLVRAGRDRRGDADGDRPGGGRGVGADAGRAGVGGDRIDCPGLSPRIPSPHGSSGPARNI